MLRDLCEEEVSISQQLLVKYSQMLHQLLEEKYSGIDIFTETYKFIDKQFIYMNIIQIQQLNLHIKETQGFFLWPRYGMGRINQEQEQTENLQFEFKEKDIWAGEIIRCLRRHGFKNKKKRRYGFYFQHPLDSSQLCNSRSGDRVLSTGFHRPCVHTIHRHT